MICGLCHKLDPQYRLVAKDGWIVGGQESAELQRSTHFTASPHYGYITCITCHNQHKSVYYNQGGIKDIPTCSTCHPDHVIPGKETLACIECHMPFSAKSTISYSSNQADMRSHLLRIWVTTAPKDSMFYTDSSGTFVKLDSDSLAVGNTLDLVCQRCHTSWSLEELYPYAENIHEEGLGIQPQATLPGPQDFTLQGNFPNPFNPSTTIVFSLARPTPIQVEVFDLSGKLLETLFSGEKSGGQHQIEFILILDNNFLCGRRVTPAGPESDTPSDSRRGLKPLREWRLGDTNIGDYFQELL